MKGQVKTFNNHQFHTNTYEIGSKSGGVKYYKKTEKKTVINSNKDTKNQYNIISNKNYSRRGNLPEREISSVTHVVREKRPYSSTSSNLQKNKGIIANKNVYTHSISSTRNMNKSEDGKRRIENDRNFRKIEKVTKIIKNIPINKPPIIKKKEIEEKTEKKELIDNYQYHETKNIKKEKKKTTVNHRRLCEPFYHTIINNSKRYNSYTERPKGFQQQVIIKREEYEIGEPAKKIEHPVSIKLDNLPGLKNYRNYSSRTGNYRRNDYKIKESKTTTVNSRRAEADRKIKIPTPTNRIKRVVEKRYEQRGINRINNNVRRHEIEIDSNNLGNNNNVGSNNNTITYCSSIANEKSRNIPRGIRQYRSKEEIRNNRNVNESKLTKITNEIRRKYGRVNVQKKEEEEKKEKVVRINRRGMQNTNIYERKKINKNLPQQVNEIEIKDRRNRINIPQQVHQLQVYERNKYKSIPQQAEQIKIIDKEGEKNINKESIEQNEILEHNENIEQNVEQNVEQNEYMEQNENQEIIEQPESQENRECTTKENYQQEEEMYNEEKIEENEENQRIGAIEISQENQNEEENNMEQEEEKSVNEERIDYIPIQNKKEEKKVIEISKGKKKEYIQNQMNMRGAQMYHEEMIQQNNINCMNGVCPIHGIHNNNVNQIYNIHGNEKHVMGDNNNYKFYESKNIRNYDGEVNSITLHQMRGDNNYGELSHLYMATRSYPIISDMSYQQQYYQTSQNYNNAYNEHLQFCPVHGNVMISVPK